MSQASTDASGFHDLGLRPELTSALSELGYEEPTPIQRSAIPPLLTGRDLIGQAATGTGKTAAFALPLLARLDDERSGTEPIALVLVPTRELAMQVSEAIHRYGLPLGARVLPIYGGQPIGRQLKVLRQGVDVVVATPGRALDHITRGTLRLHRLEAVVLDEADEMLDMGFAEDLDAILDATPQHRQTMLFSATLPSRIVGLARRRLHDPVRVTIGHEPVTVDDRPLVRQSAYLVPRAHKPAALGRILDVEAPDAAIVFCRTRNEVDALTQTLNGRGHRAEALHGGMTQDQRDRVMDRLRGGTADLLVATDVAARGLDIGHLTHVVNYDVPSAPEAYVHRIGRVGRAGREGAAVTLIEPREHPTLLAIERHVGQQIPLESVPSVADLRARRLEMTRASLHETLLGDDLEHVRVVVETLADEFDLMEIALAAVTLAHEAGAAGGSDEELPDVSLRQQRPTRSKERGGRSTARRPAAEMTRLYIGAGRAAGIRPKDLVGAIANESSLRGEEIGAIEITQNFSLVEVPVGAADEVVAKLRRSTIKGRKAQVRRDRNAPR